jgi:xanthine dehydrogenase accessory factor
MSHDPQVEVLTALLAAQNAGQSAVLVTVTQARGSVPRRAGAKMVVFEDGRFQGTIGGGEMEARAVQEALAVLQNGHPKATSVSLVSPERGDPGLCGGEVTLFMEPYWPPATVFIIGCGHVGQAVAAQAKVLGYRVVVTDDREALASPEHVPDADVYLPGSIDSALQAHPITRNTYVVVVTRNVQLDRQILPKLAQTPAPYIGVMGSRRRWAETSRLLLADGLPPEALERFHSPLGLELNAETPAEIALSILAEIVMVRRGGTGSRMSAQGTAQAQINN